MNALESLKNIAMAFPIEESEEYKIIEQALTTKSKKEKAFDIIKEKNVDTFELKQALSVKQYNNVISFKLNYIKYMELTQEEFNLLKEVL